MDNKVFRSYMLLIAFGIVLIVAVVKVDLIAGFLGILLNLLKPFFIGGAIAFILNIPYSLFVRKLEPKLKYGKLAPIVKPVSLVGAYLLCVVIIGGVVSFVIPELAISTSRLISNIGIYVNNLENLVYQLAERFQWQALNIDVNSVFAGLEKEIEQVINSVIKMISDLFPQIFSFTTGVLQSMLNLMIGIILSIYMLSSRDKLKRQAIHLTYAFLSKKVADKVSEVGRLTAECFTKFISGQLMEACILSVLCFIGMTIFRFDYAFLISVIIGATSIIPVIGAFIGAIPAVFLLLMIDPIQAVWFIVFIIILQQLEGNIIYPRTVGDSIGLPAIWVMMAILVGGGFAGPLGMLMGVPMLTVIYKLLSKETYERLRVKGSEEEGQP